MKWITYQYFNSKLNNKIKSNEDFYYELLKTVASNPNRYTGIFRLTSAKTKLLQNVTQSREIKFGDFMEDIVTDYISEMGFENLPKNIGNDLNADQIFKNGTTVYLIEQKIRDDHDSTKKRGQYENFKKKYTYIQSKYPNNKIIAVMWFIDESLVRNKKYYESEASGERYQNLDIHILYGGKLFSEIFNCYDVWQEICNYLKRNKQERSNELLSIPDFDTSEEMLGALRRLKAEKRSLFTKLTTSAKLEYVQLRDELFTAKGNLSKV